MKEERQDKRREDEREKRDGERGREKKMKEKMERDRDERNDDFFPKNVSRPLNPPDELAQNVSKKSLSNELLLHFSSRIQNLTVFSIIYMIRIRFFGWRELNQNGFRRARYFNSGKGEKRASVAGKGQWSKIGGKKGQEKTGKG